MRRSLGITPVAVFSRHVGGQHVFTYGAGIAVGAEITTKNTWRVQPYLDGGIGFLVFAQPAPVPDSRRFNFDFYFGPGLRIPRRRIRFGVWYHHFSNGYTTVDNPGIDSIIGYVGYSFYRKR
jgi:hypothetical protein